MKHTNEEAVSPVIGVILMVAITVILAAVIASFVFGMSGTITRNYIVAVNAHQIDSSHIAVTYLGGQDARSVQSISVNVTNSTDGTYSLGTTVGSTITVTPKAGVMFSNERVLVVGTFTDNAQQVILDTYI